MGIVLKGSLVLVWLFGWSGPAISQKKPQTREELWKLIRSYDDRAIPRNSVPVDHEYYTWRVTGTFAGFEVFKEQVPVYQYLDNERRFKAIGQVPVGTAFVFSQFRSYSNKYYYRVDPANVTLDREYKGSIWIPGEYIEKDRENSFKLPEGFTRRHGLKTKVERRNPKPPRNP